MKPRRPSRHDKRTITELRLSLIRRGVLLPETDSSAAEEQARREATRG